MKKSLKKICLLTATLMVSTLLMTACSSSNAAKPTEGGSNQTEKTEYNAVINYGLTSAWDSINPYGASASGSFFNNLVLDKLYDRLAYVEEAGKKIKPRGEVGS